MTLLDDPRSTPRAKRVVTTSSWRGRADDGWQSLRRWESTASDRLILGLLVVVALVLRIPRLGIRYWGDEAIAVGIAGRPLRQIPHYLGYDGAPPLWYLLLHGWMRIFGHSEVSTHTMSLLISVVAIPVAWWCGDVLFGRRAARASALLASVSPYLAFYGTETRMYVLLGVLSMVAVTAFIRFYQEAPLPGSSAVRGAAGRWLGLAALASVAVLYTHNWGLFLVGFLVAAGAGAAWWRGDRVRLGRVGAFALIVGAAYLPWVPSFISQLRNTGAPWAPHPQLIDFIVDPFNVSCSAAWFVVLAAIALTVVAKRRAGSSGPWFVLRAGRLSRRSNRATASVSGSGREARIARSSSAGSTDRQAGWGWSVNSPLGLGAVIVIGTVVVGWIASQFVHAWSPRYLGVAVVPAFVILAGMFAESRIGRRCLLVSTAALALTSLPVLLNPGGFADSKSNVAAVDATLSPDLVPGDLVVTTALAELPVIAYYLPSGLRYATPLGVVSDPRVVNWQHLPTRLQEAQPTISLAAVLASVPVGGHILVINPLTFSSTETPAQYAGITKAEGVAVNQDILLDPDFTSVRTVRPSDPGSIANPVEGTVYTRTG